MSSEFTPASSTPRRRRATRAQGRPETATERSASDRPAPQQRTPRSKPSDHPSSDRPQRTRGENAARPQNADRRPRQDQGDRPAKLRADGSAPQPARRRRGGRGGNNGGGAAAATPYVQTGNTIGADAAPARPVVELPSAPATTAPDTSLTFAELGVPAGLLPALTALGAVHPFPIQSASLPSSMQGKDVLGRGRTGSGKTIAFALPLVHQLTGARSKPHHPRGMILVPTRELALQVMRTVQPLAKAAGLTVTTVFGGVGFGNQISALKSGVDIIVACPGRLEDLIKRRDANLSQVKVTVLDEADHMADLGFLPGVRRILKATPANGQRLMFSATLDGGISVLANDFLTNPVTHEVDEVDTPVANMEHHVFTIHADDRGAIIRDLAAGDGRRILFARTKHGAKRWAGVLRKNGIDAVELHGNLAQNARERNLAAFHDGSARVLVATDIAARGIHVDDVALVVHLEPPAEHKAYVHRSGRTARAGAGGIVVTLMLAEQAGDVRKLLKAAGISASARTVRPGDKVLTELAG